MTPKSYDPKMTPKRHASYVPNLLARARTLAVLLPDWLNRITAVVVLECRNLVLSQQDKNVLFIL